MKQTIHLLGIPGSLRQGSFNLGLLNAAAELLPEDMSLEIYDLSAIPLFNADLKAQGEPGAVAHFKSRIALADALLIATPEYNYSLPGVLKNAIDWASRPAHGEAILGCFVDKVAALMVASPSVLGGLRGLAHFRALLSNIQVTVLPNQVTITKADEAFKPDGSLIDPKQQSAVTQLGAELAHIVAQLNT